HDYIRTTSPIRTSKITPCAKPQMERAPKEKSSRRNPVWASKAITRCCGIREALQHSENGAVPSHADVGARARPARRHRVERFRLSDPPGRMAATRSIELQTNAS